MVRSELGRLYLAKGAYSEALVETRQVMHMLARTLGECDPRTADAIDQVGLVLLAQHRYSAAADLHRHALALREEYYGTDSPQVASSLAHLANALQGEGKVGESLLLRERSVAVA